MNGFMRGCDQALRGRTPDLHVQGSEATLELWRLHSTTTQSILFFHSSLWCFTICTEKKGCRSSRVHLPHGLKGSQLPVPAQLTPGFHIDPQHSRSLQPRQCYEPWALASPSAMASPSSISPSKPSKTLDAPAPNTMNWLTKYPGSIESWDVFMKNFPIPTQYSIIPTTHGPRNLTS